MTTSGWRPVDVRPYSTKWRGVWKSWMGSQLREAKFNTSSAPCCGQSIYEGDVIMPMKPPKKGFGHVECVLRDYGKGS